MSTIRIHETTTSTPEQFVAALTDFGPGRSKIFGNSADAYLKVHRRGQREADVTEGSGGIWERLHYDWSDGQRVVMTTTDSRGRLLGLVLGTVGKGVLEKAFRNTVKAIEARNDLPPA
ncbi:MAG TPA: hypothetical protein VFQ07_07445 [Candidatus Polarisedimenticolia bacterium]|nr:hypothetical protein [Candidatus Polarisedimenticolia bacterium]